MRVKKKRRKHRSKYGRLLIFCIFLWFRIADMAQMQIMYPHLSVGYQQGLVVFLVAMGLWSTGLLAAVWFRQLWAKYVLVASQILVVVFSMSVVPSLPDSGDSRYRLWLSVAMVSVYLPAIIVLVASKQIHKLTEPKGLSIIPS